MIQLNTKTAPFDDKRAREAIYHATDFDAILKGLFSGPYPSAQSFTGPGGLFHKPTVPGYPTYDLEQAKQLGSELGGLTVTLGTLNGYVAQQAMRRCRPSGQAGINVEPPSHYELSS